MKKVLLIGGAGFIGSHLAPLLIQHGYQVQILGRSAMDRSNLLAPYYLQGNFQDEKLLERLVQEHDEVVSLAYATVPNTSFADPLADLNQNLPPALRLMQLCVAKQKRLILISSGGTVYGQSIAKKIDETHPTHPISPYGITKLTIEHYAYLFSISHGLKYVCIRPSNPYGVGQLPFRGQGFIATALGLIAQKKAVPIFGASGTVRDYIAISDLAKGILAAMNHGLSGEIYNIGSGVGRSNVKILEDLAPMVKQKGYEVTIEPLPARPFDVASNVLDSSKLMNISGWKPEIAFQTGLQDLVDSVLSQHQS